MSQYDPTKEIEKQLENFLNIGIALSAEKDHFKLLEMILNEARRITRADAGTIYLAEEDYLVPKLIHNDTLNIHRGGTAPEKPGIPPVPIDNSYVAGYTAISGQSVNIEDVYNTQSFDFSGPKKYDQITGYRTQSLLVAPLNNHHDEVIGVLQLINALDQDDAVHEFSSRHETVVDSLSSLAAISLTNQQLIKDIENLFESFVQVMVTAIESKTPYNANHTKNVTKLAVALAKAVDQSEKPPFAGEHFDIDRLKQLEMSGWLHDIGKVSISLAVMNKSTRLDNRLPLVITRMQLAKEQALKNLYAEMAANFASSQNNEQQQTDMQAYHQKKEQTAKAYDELITLIKEADNPDKIIEKETRETFAELINHYYIDEQGENKPLLTEEELDCLTVPKGTLTEKEKRVMQQHVDITGKILNEIPFTKKLTRVPEFASMHHELLNGKGYPQGLQGEAIPLEARILTIADIFDALTATDRPYKEGKSIEKALEIMKYMVNDGEIDGNLYEIFAENEIWQVIKS